MYYLATQYQNGPQQLNDISSKEGISEKYLSQIVIQLRLSGLINSLRGAQGGYFLSKDPAIITIREIVESLEGGISIVDCATKDDFCSKTSQCATHEVWKRVNDSIINTLNQVTLQDLIHITDSKHNDLNYVI
jgi:Rrf2 family protein